MASNTEPIPVKDALRLCEMALDDCDKATPGPWLQRGEGIDAIIWENSEIAVACTFRPDMQAALANAAFIVLSRAVMRPLIEAFRIPLAKLNPTWVVGHTADMYPPLAALRDHYDKARPNWRKSK